MDSHHKSVNYIQLFRYASHGNLTCLFIGFLCAIIAASGLPLSLILFGRLANSFVYFAMTKETGSSIPGQDYNMDDFMQSVEDYGIGSLIIGIGQLIFCYLMIVCISKSAEAQVYRIRLLYIKSLLRQDIAWFDTYEGDFISQVGESLIKLEDGMGQKLAILIFLVFECLISVIVAFVYGWELTLVILSVSPVLIVSTLIFSKVQTHFGKKELDAYSRAAALAEEALSAIRTVVAFGGEEKIVEWYKNKLNDAYSAACYKGIFRGIGNALSWTIDYSSYSIAFWYGIKLVTESRDNQTNEYDPSTLIIIFFCSMMGAMCLGLASAYLDEFNTARMVASPIYQIIERVPVIDSSATGGMDPKILIGSIAFHNVHFAYPARPEVPILNGINLQFRRGETVALVGSSGCGKSTILQLIIRLYDADEGEVLIDGLDIKRYNVCSIRKKIGYVGQEPVLFDFSIRENIELAKEGKLTQTELENATSAANAHDFITKLPNQYDTIVGDKGAFLSGGQKQRIAIARGLVKKPTILLLDEATSALDNQSEAMVQAALDSSTQKRTTVIVAHRLSSVRNADRIIVLDRGKVIEIGKHNTLMGIRGFYYNLVRSQVMDVDDIDVESEAELKMYRILRHEQQRKLSILSASKRFSEEFVPKSPVFWRLIKLSKHEWWLLLIGCFGAFGFGITIPLYSIIFGEVMGVLAIPDTQEARAQANKYSFYFLVVAIWAGIFMFIQTYVFSITGEMLTRRLRTNTLEAMLGQEVAWFDEPEHSVGALCARLSIDATNVQGATGVNFALILQSIAALGISFIIAVYLVWKQALVSSIMIPLICLGTYLESKFLSGQIAKEMENQEQASRIAVEALSNIKTVSALCKQDVFFKKYTESLKASRKKTSLKYHWRGVLYGFSQAVQSWSYGLSLWYGGYLIKKEGVSYADVLAVGELLIFGAMVVGQSIAFAPNYTKGLTSAARIFSLLDRTPKIATSEKQALEPEKPVDNYGIEFSHVSFVYPMRAIKVLRDFSCVIEHGKTVALVGSSGSGKSTCIQLLERFYDTNSGEVSIAGQNIKSFNLQWLRAQLGLVSQEPVLFDCTIEENIAFGDNTRKVKFNEIIEAAEKANIHKFVVNLPKGYHTNLGRKGTQLSGGQKQRIAIARALLRNPKVLLLDEATSALDAESEKVVQAALDVAMHGRTCVMIAHRLITVQDADKIVVMHSGRVMEQGTHQELMKKRGLYYGMVLLSRR